MTAVATTFAPFATVHAQGLMLPVGVAPADATATADSSEAASKERWVLGATLASTPSYSGGAERSLGLRPVLAGRVGRWLISSSSARGLAGVELAGGVSTTVAQTERWSFGVGARLTHGRNSADDAMLSGLPDIKSSVGIRASARYTLAPGWRLTGSLQQDLLYSQGLRGVVGLGWTQPVGSGWVLDVNGGLNVANARAMNTYFGVTDAGARAGRPAWQAGGGLESWFWGVGLTRALSPHWRMAGSIGRGTLLGDAARS
ncbi:MAG: MipA/OmpV family protein, partial [Burkholderiales bacterium]|nr:MipA/OmpV family protein [Burkholderiales bacterium]